MTTLLDHRSTEDDVHYGEPVSESQYADEARRAIEQIAAAEDAAAAARAARDSAVVRMYRSGMKAPQIARATAMSESNVRLILKVALAQSDPDR